MAPPPTQPALLLLAGGGAMGPYQLGVVAKFLKTFPHARFTVAAGVSVGALISGMFAFFRDQREAVDEALRMFLAGCDSRLFFGVPNPLAVCCGKSVLTSRNIERDLKQTCTRERYMQYDSGAVAPHGARPFVAAEYTSLDSGQTDRVTNAASYDSFVDGLMASSALPSVFEAQDVGGEWCVDGSIRHMLPSVPPEAKDAAFAHILVVLCHPPGPLGPVHGTASARDVANRTAEIVCRDNLRADVVRMWNEVRELTAKYKTPPNIFFTHPTEPVWHPLWLGRKDVVALFDMGRATPMHPATPPSEPAPRAPLRLVV